MKYCEACGHVHESSKEFDLPNAGKLSLKGLKSGWNKETHNACCALIESLAFFSTNTTREEWLDDDQTEVSLAQELLAGTCSCGYMRGHGGPCGETF